jgi:hypothetical protein
MAHVAGEVAKRVERLLYVNLCHADQPVFLQGYFEKGAASFARQNPGLKFAEIHLPSLMMAIERMPGRNLIQLLSSNPKMFLTPIGWKDPLFDEALKAYRAQSEIQIVNWYRL